VGIAVLPHTRTMTNLRFLRSGDPVNVEADATIKLVAEQQKARRSGFEVTVNYLLANGY
jgi:riboflavin synthase alpha subunit